MVRYSVLLGSGELLEKFSKYSKIYGVVFLILGLVGIFFPAVMSLSTALFYGWLLILASFAIGLHTWQTNKKDWLGWLKSMVLLMVGILIILNPMVGVAALGILFAVYFLMDAFASMALALEIKPSKGWWLSSLNGVLSLVIGIYLIVSWPVSSLFLIGIFVGVSLFFDGILLLSMGSTARKLKENA